MLVEPKDVDPFTYRISVESPLGKALLHKHRNDLVRVDGPRSTQTYFVDDIIPSSFVAMEGGWL